MSHECPDDLLDRYRAILKDNERPGWTLEACEDCGQAGWISPDIYEMMDAGAKFKFICQGCAGVELAQAKEERPDLRASMGPAGAGFQVPFDVHSVGEGKIERWI